MAAFQNFRTAFHGFNREDVVHYLEYIGNKHTSQLNQLKTELQVQGEELAALREQAAQYPALQEELTALREEKARLEQALADAPQAPVEDVDALHAELASLRTQLTEARANAAASRELSELETYRRAERAERLAAERVSLLYDRANGALAEATLLTDETASQMGEAADRLSVQLAELQTTLLQGKAKMKDASAAMYAIRPIQNDE